MRTNTRTLATAAILAMATVLFLGGCAANRPDSGATALATQDTSPEAAPLAALAPNPLVRVLLINSVPEITIVPRSEWVARSEAGVELARCPAAQETTICVDGTDVASICHGRGVQSDAVVLESAEPGGTLEIKKVPYGVGWWWAGVEDRYYEGRIEIRAVDGKLEVVAHLPLEDYLLGVVPSEIGADSPLEAMKAQAIAARSETLNALTTRKYAGAHYDICSDVECQAFTGNTKRTKTSDEAVLATRGQALFFENMPIAAYYASSCGGFTDDIRNVWPERAGEKSYWDIAHYDGPGACAYNLTLEDDVRKWVESSPETYCNPTKFQVPAWASKNFRWEREVTADDLTKWVAAKSEKNIGRVTGIRAVKRGPSGRMIEAEFIGEGGVYKTGPELAIRQVFDPPLKSSTFVVDVKGPEARPDAFVIRGAGWGHGIGMCQTGAIAMANMGKPCAEILAHYYPTSAIKAVYP